MPESLPALEKDRSDVLRQISHLGDLRPGSILEVMGRCSKPNCHCAQPGDPGHGPNFRLTRKVKGKTVAETLSSPAALRDAFQSGGFAQGPARGGRVSQVPAIERETGGGE
jgi:hypothetical protein